MKSAFHEGEQEVQERVGVAAMAERLSNGIHSVLPPISQEFLRHQPMVIVGSVDAEGAVWASLLTGEPGFMQALDENTVRVNAAPLPEDPLKRILDAQARQGLLPEIGLLAIELATRRRMRVNGAAKLGSEGGFTVQVHQAYANCPKYIQSRSFSTETATPMHASTVRHGDWLRSEQQEWIARSDTFFIASVHPVGGADASHRGGNPGFIHVLDGKTLAFPDYAGNNMFNTLGNIAVNPHVGLLFIDFENGNTLQITGNARILWDAEHARLFPGAQRVIAFHVDSVLHTENAVPLRWQFVQMSPFNPK